MASILEQLLDNEHLVVGISELSNMTGTSPRQLRYWEQKGWIAAIPDEQHAARRYQLPAVVKAELIKKFLDEGFTLKKAAEKAEARLKKVSHVQTVLPNILHDVKVIDDRFTIFSLGVSSQRMNVSFYYMIVSWTPYATTSFQWTKSSTIQRFATN